MAENITTLLDRLDAENITLADFIYLVQGTGANRDRKMTLQQLRDFLTEAFTSIKMVAQGGNMELTAGAIKFIAESGKTVGLSFLNGLEIGMNSDGDAINIVGASGYCTISTSGIKFGPKNSAAKIALTWDGLLKYEGADGEKLAGIDKDGTITGKVGAGFRNAAAENTTRNVSSETLVKVVSIIPEMKYFVFIADGATESWSVSGFDMNAGTNEGYQYGEEVVVFNDRSSSLTVHCGAGNVSLAAGHAMKFILLKSSAVGSTGFWAPLS